MQLQLKKKCEFYSYKIVCDDRGCQIEFCVVFVNVSVFLLKIPPLLTISRNWKILFPVQQISSFQLIWILVLLLFWSIEYEFLDQRREWTRLPGRTIKEEKNIFFFYFDKNDWTIFKWI